LGAGALAAGLVTGFVVDPTQTAARDAGYALVGGALALGVGALVLGATSRATAERARRMLLVFGRQCE
jgi:hypothetical protein